MIKDTIQQHEAFSVGFYFVSDHEDIIPSTFEFKRGKDCTQWFAQRVREIAFTVNDILFKINKPVQMNIREKLKHEVAEKCYLCQKPFTCENYKVIDHCHLSGTFLGSCHNECNLIAQKKYFLPIFFHNFSGFDSHIIIRDIVQHIKGGISVIAKNVENYISLTMYLKKNTKMKIIF